MATDIDGRRARTEQNRVAVPEALAGRHPELATTTQALRAMLDPDEGRPT